MQYPMFYLVGIVITLFLASILISKKGKTDADRILVSWLVVICIHLTLFYLFITGKNFSFPFLLGLEMPLPLLHGPLLYLYTAAVTNQLGNKYRSIFHFVPFLLWYLPFIPFITRQANEKIAVYKQSGAGYETTTTLLLVCIIISGIVYVAFSLGLPQPAGNDVFDDFKTKTGGQIRVYQIQRWHFTAKVQGIFRRFENDYVRILNFGSDMAAIVGYYKPTWYATGEFGFDKAIVTNFKHSRLFRENFPDVKDGWYEPSTGGNFYYGVQIARTFDNCDLTLKLGKVIQQDFKTDPTVPYYFQIGYNRKF